MQSSFQKKFLYAMAVRGLLGGGSSDEAFAVANELDFVVSGLVAWYTVVTRGFPVV